MSTRGRHELPHIADDEGPSLIRMSAREVELEAAWKDGHEAAIEEMNDPQNSGIRGYYLMYFALMNDVPLTPEQVKKVWDDRFLTNIIVPILEHIKRHDDNLLGEAFDDGDPVQEAFYSRRMVDLDHVQTILKEWRG